MKRKKKLYKFKNTNGWQNKMKEISETLIGKT